MNEPHTIRLRGAKARGGGMGLVWALALAMAAAALGLAGPRGALAAPDPPVVTPYQYIFRGDQSQGILSGRDFNVWAGKEIIIESLSKNISPASVPGISVNGKGADGGDGANSSIVPWDWHGARNGGAGNEGAEIRLIYKGNNSQIRPGAKEEGISVVSGGGRGGDGGNAVFPFTSGGNGGGGGDARMVVVDTSLAKIFTNGAAAVNVKSVGGDGGNGGTAKSLYAHGGRGGNGGDGWAVAVRNNNGLIVTTGENAAGMMAASVGGKGGDGNEGISGTKSYGGYGGKGGDGGTVIVSAGFSRIYTTGNNSSGIWAVSRGGQGGNGGFGGGIKGVGGPGGGGGSGGSVRVSSAENWGQWKSALQYTFIQTAGDQSYGIAAQSFGGKGGDGGDGKGFKGKGGSAAKTGTGGSVEVNWAGDIKTYGQGSGGILAQSVGGFGGTGGSGSGFVGYGASGESGGDGGAVSVTMGIAFPLKSTITTQGNLADAICAQSIGGGGGNGGKGLIFGNEGEGGAGGKGGEVSVSNKAAISTGGFTSRGIFAQSIGGGGGAGGDAFGIGLFLSVDMGGKGGTGGSGGKVLVDNYEAISTYGANSAAICAQSIGGGGGSGGYSVSGAAGVFNFTAALGGSGGEGGAGGAVRVNNSAALTTYAWNSMGVLAQSIGGGGGAGGFSIAASAGGFAGKNVSLGGAGGKGGQGGQVEVTNTGDISTAGGNAHAICAQSVGGGGGSGGFSIAAGAGQIFSSGVGIGGSAGSGGNGGLVTVASAGKITTQGANACGIFAQSLGGGGGNAGYNITGILGIITVPVSLGGSGGDGGKGDGVQVTSASVITTQGENACGILAQSVGGGGGNGGLSFTGVIGGLSLAGGQNLNANLFYSMGGSGGSGGKGGEVTVTNRYELDVNGNDSYGIYAQSLGGGGGAGGMSIAGSLSSKAVSGPGSVNGINVSIGASVGGKGGQGNDGGAVTVVNEGKITTRGGASYGILAESIGGGGGNGGDSKMFNFMGVSG